MIAVLCIMMTACGETSEAAVPTPSNASGNTVPADKPKEEQPKTETVPAEYTIKDYVVADNDQCQFKINEVKDKKGSAEFSVYCENRTEETNLMFAIDNCSANGCAIDPFWADTVAPGKKANGTFTFNKADLDLYGISSIDELRFELRIYDSDDWIDGKVVEEIFTVYPTGKAPDEVVYPRREEAPSDYPIEDNDDFRFVICESGEGTFWAYYLTVYAENKTDSNVMVTWRDVSVNGYMCDPFYAVTIPPHSCRYSDVTFSDTAFEENGIETVEEIEFELYVYDNDSWTTQYLYETYTYSP